MSPEITSLLFERGFISLEDNDTLRASPPYLTKTEISLPLVMAASAASSSYYSPALLALVILAAVGCCSAVKVEYDPFEQISMKSHQNISLRLSFNSSTGEEADWPEDQKVVLTFGLSNPDSWAVEILNQSLTFDYDQIRRRKRLVVCVGGWGWGVGQVLRSVVRYLPPAKASPRAGMAWVGPANCSSFVLVYLILPCQVPPAGLQGQYAARLPVGA